MPTVLGSFSPLVKEVLTTCGFDSISNDKEYISELIIKVACAYKAWDFDLSGAADLILIYNGLTIDAAHAIRKSMKEYDFSGGFRFSLENILSEKDTLHDEFILLRRYTERKLFPVGKAFSEIMSVDEQGRVYAGENCLADSFDEFLERLIGNYYKDFSKRKKQ